MQIVTQFPHEITEEPDMGITMPDGCRLSARVWMPKDAAKNPVPAILEYIPYRKRDGTVARDEIMHKYFAGRGYAVVRLDMRGSGDSEGLLGDEYSPGELEDGCEAIKWIAAQDWCDGNVGMMGKSWGGFNCLQVAALQPPALKAIISVCSTVDRFADDIHFKGGCLLNDNLAWSSVMLGFSSRPPDPKLVGERWREMWLERLEAEPHLAPLWLRHQGRDAYWRHGSVCEDYSAIKAAVLAVGGWADNYMNAVPQLIENISSPVKGIVGPWVHQYPHQADPEPQIGFLQEAVRWWDHWLKGQPNGVDTDPAYRVWRQETVRPKRAQKSRPGVWVAEKDWPSPRVTQEKLALAEGGILGGKATPLNLTFSTPLDCGYGTGRYFPMSGDAPEMPGDQRDDDARSVCFDSEALDKPLDIIGAPTLRLRLKSDLPKAQIAVRLCEVHPDGASTRITYGVLNLCHRDDPAHPTLLTPGEAVEVSVRFDHIAYRVKPGMRLRIAISTGLWPFLWPSPATPSLTLLSGELDLPKHGGPEVDEWQFEQAEGAEPWQHRAVRPPLYDKKITHDLVSGEITLSLFEDHGLNEDAAHGLISGSTARESWTIHPDDPLSARGEIHHTHELSRDNWSVRTETYAKMWGDADTFYLSARIEAYEGESLVFEQDFLDEVVREFL